MKEAFLPKNSAENTPETVSPALELARLEWRVSTLRECAQNARSAGRTEFAQRLEARAGELEQERSLCLEKTKIPTETLLKSSSPQEAPAIKVVPVVSTLTSPAGESRQQIVFGQKNQSLPVVPVEEKEAALPPKKENIIVEPSVKKNIVVESRIKENTVITSPIKKDTIVTSLVQENKPTTLPVEKTSVTKSDAQKEILPPIRVQEKIAIVTPKENIAVYSAQENITPIAPKKYSISPNAKEYKPFSRQSKIPSSCEIIDYDIRRISKGRPPFSGADITESAVRHGIPPELLAAFLRNDSSYGTKGRAVRSKNPGNVGQYNHRKDDANLPSWSAGLDACAANLARRIESYRNTTGRNDWTVREIATGKTRDGKRFFEVYMTDQNGPVNVEKIYTQLASADIKGAPWKQEIV